MNNKLDSSIGNSQSFQFIVYRIVYYIFIANKNNDGILIYIDQLRPKAKSY